MDDRSCHLLSLCPPVPSFIERLPSYSRPSAPKPRQSKCKPPETRKTLVFETMFDKEGVPQGGSGIARNLHSCTRRQNAGGTSTHHKYTEERRTREVVISDAISSDSCFLGDRRHFAAYLHHLFKTLLDCQEEAQKHLDEPAAQPSQHNTSHSLHTVKKRAAQKMRRKKREARGPHEHTRSTRLFFLPACQANPSPKSGGLMSARRDWDGNGHAGSMRSFLRVPSQAAHPMQRRPDGTKRSRRV